MPFSNGVLQRLRNWVSDRNNSIKIMADLMDGEFDNVVGAVNDVVSGVQPFTGSLKVPFGTTAAPGIQFSGDNDTGIARTAPNTLALVTAGAPRLTVNDSMVTVPDGTAAAAGVAFSSDTNTGLYRAGADSLGLTAGGVPRLTVGATDCKVEVPIAVVDGSGTLPAIHPSSAISTGIYFPAPSGTLALSTGGVESARFTGNGIKLASEGVTTAYFDKDNALLFVGDGAETRLPGSGNIQTGVSVSKGGIIYASSTAAPACFNRNASNGNIIQIRRDGDFIAAITATPTTVSYNTSSDYRLKHPVTPPEYDPAAFVKALAGAQRWYGWNSDPAQIDLGWYAHELQEIEPRAVTGVKDGDEMQGRDDTKLVVHLVAALAQALRRIEALEAQA